MELYECAPLNARITKATCERNRKRGGTGGYGKGAEKIFACEGCPGVGSIAVSTEVETVEVKMGKKVSPAKLKKGDLFDCPGCGKRLRYESKGLCGSCNQKKRLAAKQAADLPAGPVTKPDAVHPDLPADAAELKEPFGKLANVEGAQDSFGVDPVVHMAMRDAWYEVERKALEALSGLSPTSALIRAANFVQQIQRLEVQP